MYGSTVNSFNSSSPTRNAIRANGYLSSIYKKQETNDTQFILQEQVNFQIRAPVLQEKVVHLFTFSFHLQC